LLLQKATIHKRLDEFNVMLVVFKHEFFGPETLYPEYRKKIPPIVQVRSRGEFEESE
jgi:hypothetical protein